MKIVVNKCYGGFGLSEKAVLRYAELKGIKLYSKKESLYTAYYTVPIEEYNRLYKIDLEKGNYKASNKVCFSPRNIKRDDVLLVQVVEELGHKANGKCADLQITEIPDGVDWEIDEYDGNECVEEKHRSW